MTPRFGTKSDSTRRRSQSENVMRADEHRQGRLQHPVAVPEPHVAGREGARRHLDDEDGDRDDEARERRRRSDDRGEHAGRRRRRIGEVLREIAIARPTRARRCRRPRRGRPRSGAATQRLPRRYSRTLNLTSQLIGMRFYSAARDDASTRPSDGVDALDLDVQVAQPIEDAVEVRLVDDLDESIVRSGRSSTQRAPRSCASLSPSPAAHDDLVRRRQALRLPGRRTSPA